MSASVHSPTLLLWQPLINTNLYSHRLVLFSYSVTLFLSKNVVPKLCPSSGGTVLEALQWHIFITWLVLCSSHCHSIYLKAANERLHIQTSSTGLPILSYLPHKLTSKHGIYNDQE